MYYLMQFGNYRISNRYIFSREFPVYRTLVKGNEPVTGHYFQQASKTRQNLAGIETN